MNDKIRLAILGCGAITRSCHIPAVSAHREVDLVALVDLDAKRAAALAERYGLKCRIATDYHLFADELDAVIIALPNSLHASVTLDALNAGVHVLCEKPLAIMPQDARASAELAVQKNLVLAVGMNRRFAPSTELVRLVLEEGLLGVVRDYTCEHGGSFDWETASGFYFSKTQAGGGVLIDHGVHLLDLLWSWFGPVTQFDYQDDDWGGGIESNVVLDLRHSGRNDTVKGHVRLSRTHTLSNRTLLRGSLATAEILAADPTTVVLHRTLGGQPISETLSLPGRSSVASNTFYRQLDNFVQSIRAQQRPEVDGWQALHVLELIHDCYAHRRRLPEPWAEPFESVTKVHA